MCIAKDQFEIIMIITLGKSTWKLIIESVMFNHDTPWKNIFYFIQKCYGIKELDIFKI